VDWTAGLCLEPALASSQLWFIGLGVVRLALWRGKIPRFWSVTAALAGTRVRFGPDKLLGNNRAKSLAKDSGRVQSLGVRFGLNLYKKATSLSGCGFARGLHASMNLQNIARAAAVVTIAGCGLWLSTNLRGKSILETEPELVSLLEKIKPVPVERLPHSGTFWLLKKDEPP